MALSKLSLVVAITLFVVSVGDRLSQAYADTVPPPATVHRFTSGLGIWGAANTLWGAATLAQGTAEPDFHRMNIGWGAINLALVGVTKASPPTSLSKLTHILAFNAGLDVGYIFAGQYLKAKADRSKDRKESDQLRQFGSAIVLQGSFLLAFDLLFWYALEQDQLKVSLQPQKDAVALNLELKL